MPLTSGELTQITREHNGIQTASQVRLAIGAALKSIGMTYPVADRVSDDDTRRSLKNQLDQARVPLENWIRRIYPTGSEDYRTEWQKHREMVRHAYVVIAGVEGAANYVPRTSNWEILREAIREGQGTVAEVLTGAGQLAGGVAGAAGKGAGGLLGGIFSGLGISGTLHIAIIGAVVLLVVTKGSIIGTVRKVAGI